MSEKMPQALGLAASARARAPQRQAPSARRPTPLQGLHRRFQAMQSGKSCRLQIYSRHPPMRLMCKSRVTDTDHGSEGPRCSQEPRSRKSRANRAWPLDCCVSSRSFRRAVSRCLVSPTCVPAYPAYCQCRASLHRKHDSMHALLPRPWVPLWLMQASGWLRWVPCKVSGATLTSNVTGTGILFNPCA